MMILSREISLDEYNISSDNGFLPDYLPLQKLTHSYYTPWENLASQLPILIKTGQIRPLIDNLPILDTFWLLSEPEWRRAYSILGFLTHAYIWGGPKPQDVGLPSVELSFRPRSDNPRSYHRASQNPSSRSPHTSVSLPAQPTQASHYGTTPHPQGQTSQTQTTSQSSPHLQAPKTRNGSLSFLSPSKPRVPGLYHSCSTQSQQPRLMTRLV